MGDTYKVKSNSGNVGRNNLIVRGNGNRIRQDNSAVADDTLRELVEAVRALREAVPPEDRAKVDHSLHTIEEARASDAPGRDPGRLRAALSQVAGIAAVVGQVGVPVIDAVSKVSRLLGP